MRIVHVGLDRVGMPAVREQVFGLDPLEVKVDGDMLVARDRDAAREVRARHEVALQRHAKPGAELVRVGERAPDPRARRAENDGFLDAIRTSYATSWLHITTAA